MSKQLPTENTRFYSKTKQPATPTSGTSKLPALLKYPKFLALQPESIRNIFCYIIRHYGDNGLSVLIYRQPKNDQGVMIFGDWRGNTLDITDGSDLAKLANEFIQNKAALLYNVMQLIRLEQAQFYFAIINNELVLVDIQVSLNKFASPGMVRDTFGKTFPTQEVLKIEVIDDRALEYIGRGTGSYGGNIIVKPSRFRMFHVPPNVYTPFYVEVLR